MNRDEKLKAIDRLIVVREKMTLLSQEQEDLLSSLGVTPKPEAPPAHPAAQNRNTKPFSFKETLPKLNQEFTASGYSLAARCSMEQAHNALFHAHRKGLIVRLRKGVYTKAATQRRSRSRS